MISFIYVLKDPDTNLIRYVGKTNNIKKRYKEHLRNANYNPCQYREVYKWINSLKFKSKLPIIEVLEEINSSNIDVNKREIYWVDFYKNNLTNMTVGGKGVLLFNRKPFSEDHKRKIGDSCKGVKHYNYGKQGHSIVNVYKIDKNSGEILNEYSSILIASQNNDVWASEISECLAENRNTAGNFIWVYVKNYSEELVLKILKKIKERPCNKDKSIKVLQIDINTNDVIKTFDSIKEAGRHMNTNSAAITYACKKSKTNIYMGYKWKIDKK